MLHRNFLPVALAAGVAWAETVLQLQSVRPSDGAMDLTSTRQWTSDSELGTHAFPYRSGNLDYVVKVNVHQGRVRIYRLNANGGIVDPIANYVHARLRGTNATVAASAVPVLFVLDSFTGTVNRFRLEADGTVDFSSGDEQRNARWRDKDLFRAFRRGNTWMLFALETATGRVTIGNSLGVPERTADWTSGYTSVDHLTLSDRTYRILYKPVGNPYVADGADDDAGRVLVQLVGADGLSDDETQRILFEPGWSLLRFVERPRQGQASEYSVMAYNAETGAVRMYPFLTANGLAVFLPSWSGTARLNFTEIEPFVHDGQARLLSFTGEDVRPLTPAQTQQIGLDVHAALSDKAIGYQLMIAQSGRVVYSRAWGASRLGNPDTPMTIRTRLDLGSVSKMITTTTMLKLMEQSTGGLTMGARASLFLRDVPANSWAHNRTVGDFLMHTTGTQDEPDEADKCVRVDGYRMDCRPFYQTTPSVECNGDGCRRAYNNSNVTSQRKMIEWLTGAETSPQLVAETYQRWASRADLDFDDRTTVENNALSCRLPVQTHYFARCTEGSEGCLVRNGRAWVQNQIKEGDQEWSYTCSAGGWMGSSRQMIQFLRGVRYGWFLSDEMNAQLLSTTKQDAFGDATAVGWDSPWALRSQRFLHKNGSITKDVGFKAYITRLPNNADAVLLVNTAVPGPGDMLLANYLRATGELDGGPPDYVQYVTTGAASAPGANGFTSIALATASNGAPDDRTFSTNYVSAALRNGQLVVTGWAVDANGAVAAGGQRTSASGLVDVAVSDGRAFVTAAAGSDGLLRMSTWTVNENMTDLQPQTSATVPGTAVERVAITKTTGTGTAQGRVVTAVLRSDHRFQLQAWDFDNNTNGIVSRTPFVGQGAENNVRDVVIRTQSYGAAANAASRVLTAMETSARRLRLDLWNVAADGTITRLGGDVTSYEISDNLFARRKIALGLLPNNRFFVAFLDGDHRLRVVSYRINANNTLTWEASVRSEHTKNEVAVGGTTTLLRNSVGDLEVVRWRFSANSIVNVGSDTLGAVDNIAAAGHVAGLYTRASDREQRLRNWEVVD